MQIARKQPAVANVYYSSDVCTNCRQKGPSCRCCKQRFGGRSIFYVWLCLPFIQKKGGFPILRTPEIAQGAYELNRPDPLLFSHKSKVPQPKNSQPRGACNLLLKSYGATPQLHRHRRTHDGSYARTAAPVLPEQCLRLAGPAALLCPSASVIRRLLKRDRRHSHGPTGRR